MHAEIPPPSPREQTPPLQTATAADGTHPTGMHSCLFILFSIKKLYQYRLGTVNSNMVNMKFHLIRVSLKSLPDSYHFMFKMHS